MAFLTVEDLYGQIEVICFPKVYESARDVIKPEQTVKITGRLQLKDGNPQIVAESVSALEVVEEEKVEAKPEQEYLGVIIPDDKTDSLNDVLDVLSSYEGNIPVIIAMKGKKYNAHCSVRKCEGLMIELKNYVTDKDVIFFRKKS